MKTKMYRQGDVLIIATSDKPEGSPLNPVNGRFVLAEGEVTGHNHTITAEKNMVWVVAPEKMYLEAETDTVLTHQTHGDIEIAPGTYWVVRQRELRFGEEQRVRD